MAIIPLKTKKEHNGHSRGNRTPSSFSCLNLLQRHLLLISRKDDIKKSVRKRVDELKRLITKSLVRVELQFHLLPILVGEIPVNQMEHKEELTQAQLVDGVVLVFAVVNHRTSTVAVVLVIRATAEPELVVHLREQFPERIIVGILVIGRDGERKLASVVVVISID